jgi:hypothetical protein
LNFTALNDGKSRTRPSRLKNSELEKFTTDEPIDSLGTEDDGDEEVDQNSVACQYFHFHRTPMQWLRHLRLRNDRDHILRVER